MDDTLKILVTVDIPPDSTTNPTPDQVSFSTDQPTIHVAKNKPNHLLMFELSGVYDDGETPYPTKCLRLREDPEGIAWYSADEEERHNPGITWTDDKKRKLATWLGNHAPLVSDEGQAAEAHLNRAGLKNFLDDGTTFKLRFKIGIQVCAVDDESHPWVSVDCDPEVDIEMDA